MGFQYFYGFLGGETDQWTPYLFRNQTQVFPWIGKPGYNLTTDLADKAIRYMRDLSVAAPDKPFFHLLRARWHPLATPADQGMDRQVQR
jgi:arylsulfatase